MIISLPIGNAKDITIRALECLEKADEIYCEDTRVTRKLLSIYEIKKKLNIYHDHNGEYVRPKIIKKIKGGQSIGIVSDAGTPLISDPGYKLVLSAKKEGLHVTSCPGPSAPITALTLSGLPTDSFYYLGFLPLKKKTRDKSLNEVKNLKTSLLIFETSKKINKTLNDLLLILGNREISICREMTKKFEEIITGRIEDILPILEKREIPLEIKLRSENLPSYDRPITTPNSLKELQLSHKRGALAMARSQAIGSGSAQFYIALKALPQLDGRYSVFGKIVEGMNIVETIREGDIILKIILIKRY